MSNFDFDRPVNRRAVPALKMHRMVLGEGGEGLFAGGVADMDFAVAPVIAEAMQDRLAHGVFGYEAVPDDLFPALRAWYRARHGWEIGGDHILRAPNALNVLAIAASLFSNAGDGIIVQPPVFFDFYDVARENGRVVMPNPLILRKGRYEVDFDGLEALTRDPRNTILFLCNPHNPIGRVWSHGDLERIADICGRNGVLVVSDELHGDLALSGQRYTPFASLGEGAAMNSVTILSPAKTFNIASCCSAFTIIADPKKRAAFQMENSRLTVNKNNAFASAAMRAAYREGGPWLEAAMEYIEGNIAVVRGTVEGISGVTMIEPEATFLAWIDFRGLGMEPDALHRFLRDKAGMAMTRGVSFGAEGAGFIRLNVACRRAALGAALEHLKEATARL